MKREIYSTLIAAVSALVCAGCVTDSAQKDEEGLKSRLTRIDSTFKYVPVSEIGIGKVCTSAVVGMDTSGPTVKFSLTVGSFKVEKDKEVLLRATEKRIERASIASIADEIALRTADVPVSLFIVANGQALGVRDYKLDGECIALLRDLQSALDARNIDYVYIIPDKLTVSEK